MKTINTYEDLSTAEFQRRLNESPDSVLLDVRTPEEFQEGRIPRAINIDVTDESFPERVASMDKRKTYFIYCRSGGRSLRACSIMNSLGFAVINLTGGIMSWRSDVI
jgi:rhodanese-related sulfurtransferase